MAKSTSSKPKVTVEELRHVIAFLGHYAIHYADIGSLEMAAHEYVENILQGELDDMEREARIKKKIGTDPKKIDTDPRDSVSD